MALASSVKPSSDYEAKLYGRIYGGDEKKKRAAERKKSATERLERRQLEGKADSTLEINKMLDPRVGGLQSIQEMDLGAYRAHLKTPEGKAERAARIAEMRAQGVGTQNIVYNIETGAIQVDPHMQYRKPFISPEVMEAHRKRMKPLRKSHGGKGDTDSSDDAPSSDDTDPWEPMGAASSRSRSCNRSDSSCEPDSYSSQGYWHLANDLGYGETWEWMPLVLPRRQEPTPTFEQLQLAFALDSQLQAPLAPPQPPMETCIWRNPLIGKCKWLLRG